MSLPELTLKPYRLSPFYHKQVSLNAKFVQDENGWIRPERFNDPNEEKTKTEQTIGIYDISHLAKLSLKGNDIVTVVSDLFNQKSNIGDLLVNGPGSFNEAICAVLSNDEAILITPPSSAEAASKQLNVEAEKYQTVDVSTILGGLYLLGGKSRAVLSKLTELNVNSETFPDRTATYASLHHVQCIVLRVDLGHLIGYQVYFERAYGEYVWDIIFHAGREFGAIPIGSSTIGLLGWRFG